MEPPQLSFPHVPVLPTSSLPICLGPPGLFVRCKAPDGGIQLRRQASLFAFFYSNCSVPPCLLVSAR